MIRTANETFVKIIHRDDVDLVLKRGLPSRPAARFNRQGQDALYLSPNELSARVAIGQYVEETVHSRVLLTYRVSDFRLFDLRDPANSIVYDQAKQPWLQPLADGETHASWQAADKVRDMGYDGLIDPSRHRPGLWHITLFHWNEP
ncbi:RES family NAD+ phosphorylase, partial [Marinobacter alexandrii]|uniref:RES family NAD+ phosphorylase n=1 Tax=Marinobacter alexandrii TaxID=2570351 RepID=UPI00329A605B